MLTGLGRVRIRDIADPAPISDTKARAIVWRIIAFALVFKLILTFTLPLGIDEAYAIAVARDYSLSFFDHPPIGFWAPAAMADITGMETLLVYRLPFLLAGVLTTGLMYLIGREIGDTRTGLWSALLFAIGPFFVVSNGFLAVPDGMLNLGLALAVLFLVKAVNSESRAPVIYWVWIGLGLAFALASKYQAAWLPVAVLIFMALTPKGRRWFVQPGPWIGAAIGLLGLLPVILWNMQNNWTSFEFHTSRAGDGFSPANLARMILTQAIFLLPTGLWAAVVGMWMAIRHRKTDDKFLLALIALGPILIFNYVYFTSTSSHAHWTMPGWIFALPLAAAWLAGRSKKALLRHLRWSVVSMLVIWVPLVTLLIHSNTGFLTRPFYDHAPDWDYTFSIFSYHDLREGLDERGLFAPTDVFMARSWTQGGLFDTALSGEKPMRIFSLGGAHHFVFLEDAKATGSAIYIEATTFKDAAIVDARVLAEAQSLDPDAELLEPIILTRGGAPYVHVTLVRLRLE
ncbi:MAG: 4-amino-4-deoxy-L-arabinose transferase-like glycosyltransferase [Paracoccaceae bacterium]|jgi:4-amino-4-deoxy-L-arabinose transferase-like glycosyltransferase